MKSLLHFVMTSHIRGHLLYIKSSVLTFEKYMYISNCQDIFFTKIETLIILKICLFPGSSAVISSPAILSDLDEEKSKLFSVIKLE